MALMAVAFIALIAIAVGGLAWYTATRQRTPRQFVYVASERAEDQSPAASSDREQPGSTALPPALNKTQIPTQAAPDVVKKPAAVAPTRGRAPTSDASQLTATIRTHDNPLKACFSEHVPDQPIKALLKFSISKSGLVQRVDVQPGELAGTPLGQCLRAVAGSIKFGKQTDDLVFSVPISAHAK